MLRFLTLAFVGLFAVFGGLSSNVLAETDCEDGLVCLHEERSYLKTKVAEITPKAVEPAWLGQIVEFTYSVETRGEISADLQEFKALANETLNSSRGWIKLGVRFTELKSGGDFTLVLSAAEYLPSFSVGCSELWSCRVGRYVIINQDRWLGATDAWNEAGGSLRDYQNMVVNHEVGHWLGHDHTVCSVASAKASIMQQQSIDLGGCSFNPWPLGSELWTTRL